MCELWNWDRNIDMIEEDNECVFCGAETETLHALRKIKCMCFVELRQTLEQHFWYCRHIQELWYNIAHILDPCLDIWSYLDASSVLLWGSNPEIVEYIFMLTKRYIWKIKWKGKMCEQRGLINSIRVVYENISEYFVTKGM